MVWHNFTFNKTSRRFFIIKFIDSWPLSYLLYFRFLGISSGLLCISLSEVVFLGKSWKSRYAMSYWKYYSVRFDKYILNNLFFYNFCILSLFLVNGSQVLYVNPGHLKRISSMSLSLTNKTYLIFHSYLSNPT